MATVAGMSGVIGRIKSAGPLSCTSGFETLWGVNNGGFGLDWITDELMTVKRARRLYISPIISAWRRSRGVTAVGGRGKRWGFHPHAESLEKGIDLHTRARLRGLDLSHPLGAFNKSIQATGSPHTCGHNRRRMAKEWWWGGCEGGWHMEAIIVQSLNIPSRRQRSREKGNARIYIERVRRWQKRAVGHANQSQIPSIICLINGD